MTGSSTAFRVRAKSVRSCSVTFRLAKRCHVLQARVAVRLVDGDDCVEEPGAAGGIGTRRRLDQRRLLECANGILPFIEIAQQSQQEPIARHPRTNWNGIDQQPDDPLGAGNRRVPAGSYLAEHDIVLARKRADDHCPGGMDERRQAEAVCLAQPAKGGGGRGAETEPQRFGSGRKSRGGSRALHAVERGRLDEAAQPGPPEAPCNRCPR